MENRAPYLIVGTFVLLMLSAIMFTFLWLSKDEIEERKVSLYDVYFQGSVTGLTEGAKVTLSGVPVGTVKLVDLDPQKWGRVHVRIAVRQDMPIHDDAMASIEMQGITGYTFVQINPGTQDAPLIAALPGQKYPVIASRYSSVEELLTSLPKISNQLSNLLDRVNLVLDEENRENFSETLENIKNLSGKLNKIAEPMERMVQAATSALENIDQQAGTIGVELRDMVESSSASIKSFSQTGLYELTKTLAETKKAASNLSDVMEKLDKSPSRFLFERPEGSVKISSE